MQEKVRIYGRFGLPDVSPTTDINRPIILDLSAEKSDCGLAGDRLGEVGILSVARSRASVI